jgi:hypothetical protein
MKWVRRVLAVILALCAIPVVVAGVVLYPTIRDRLLLDRVVRAVALEWRDFGEDKARTKLQYELDHQGIGLEVGDDNCTLTEPDADHKLVACAWNVSVAVPLTSAHVPLSFATSAEIGPNGDLQ